MSDAFFNGDVAVDAKSFDGITKQIPAAQTIAPGANGGALTLGLMDQLIDLVKPGRPDALLMSKRTRRKLSDLRRSSGNLLEVDRDQFGLRALFYDGIPVVVDDFVSDTQTKGTSGAVCSSIYALKFGQGVGVMGLEHGGIQVETVGELETKDATRHRIKWPELIILAAGESVWDLLAAPTAGARRRLLSDGRRSSRVRSSGRPAAPPR